jgi:mannose-6-phosphate isomerase-like protein (cupin superfamily)
MEGFQPDPEFCDFVPRLSFHFWTRGFPEIVRFGDKRHTREIHGGNAVLFYYQTGFRSGWFLIEPGQHVNKDESMQTNPFPSMFVVTRGTMMGRIGGKEIELHEGETIYVGPEVSHEFWNEGSQSAEGIILMFGEGA